MHSHQASVNTARSTPMAVDAAHATAGRIARLSALRGVDRRIAA